MNALQTALGAVEVDAKFRDGQSDKVKVRSLPIRLLGLWGECQGDEAALVELYCGELDEKKFRQMRNIQAQWYAVNELTKKAENLKGLQEINAELARLNGEAEKVLESWDRWSDKLTPETHDKIFEAGEQINRPRYERWMKNSREATARFREMINNIVPLPDPSRPGSPNSASPTPSANAASS